MSSLESLQSFIRGLTLRPNRYTLHEENMDKLSAAAEHARKARVKNGVGRPPKDKKLR